MVLNKYDRSVCTTSREDQGGTITSGSIRETELAQRLSASQEGFGSTELNNVFVKSNRCYVTDLNNVFLIRFLPMDFNKGTVTVTGVRIP
jgi:hypothetical protein